jgi:hypothetical protein
MGNLRQKYTDEEWSELMTSANQPTPMKHTKTIDDFIKDLQSISEDKRKLPLVIDCPNGLEVFPSIKMRWDDGIMMRGGPDKMVITWRG